MRPAVGLCQYCICLDAHLRPSLARAKFCRACVNSKATCDFRQPCARCVSENVHCVYPTPLPDPEPPANADEWHAGIWDFLSADPSPVPSTFIPSDTNAGSSAVPPDTDFGSLYSGNMFDGIFSGLFPEDASSLLQVDSVDMALDMSTPISGYSSATTAATLIPDDKELAHYGTVVAPKHHFN